MEGEKKLRQNSSDLFRTAEEITVLLEIKHASLLLAPDTEREVPALYQFCTQPGNRTVREQEVRSCACGLA